MRNPTYRSLCVLLTGVFLFAAIPSFAQDVLMIGGTARSGVAGQVLRVPIVLDDNIGTVAGRDKTVDDQIRSIAFKATFSTDALVAPCSTGTNCSYVEAGIAPTLVPTADPNDPCGALDGTPNTPCFFRAIVKTPSGSDTSNSISYLVEFQNPLPTTDAPRGNLLGYLLLKLNTGFVGPLTISLAPANAFVSGKDVYPNDGDASTDETVANLALQLQSYRPADADNSGVVNATDLTTVINSFKAAPGGAVTAGNFRSDCDADGVITGKDIVCVFLELNPSASAINQTSTMDIDRNGAKDALTDGLLALRRFFGFTGTTLVSGATAGNSTRNTGTEVQAYIDAVRPAFDIDGNGSVDALTDGLLILRYIFGFRGSTLITGVVGGGATRTTAVQIEGYLGSL